MAKKEIKGGWVAFPGTKIKVAVAVEVGALEDMDWDIYQYLANIHFKHNQEYFRVFNVRVCGDYGYSKNRKGDWCLIIDLKQKNIHKIEKIQDIGKDFNDEYEVCLN